MKEVTIWMKHWIEFLVKKNATNICKNNFFAKLNLS